MGDQVLVSTRNMKSTRPKKKLDWKYAGPGRIMAQYGPSAFKVDLPGLQNIHPVFHASLLEPFNPSSQIPHPEVEIAETLTSLGDDTWEVERIIKRRKDESGR